MKSIPSTERLALGVDPQRFRALLVGIDHYSGGWDLGGCVRDALAMARWFASCGVPATNLFLCLSGENSEELIRECPELTGAPVDYASTRESIAKVLSACLKNAPGDFCLYWAGHGQMNVDHRHHLLCSDAEDAELRSFVLQDIQAHLRTSAVGSGKKTQLARSVVIVDACSNYMAIRSDEADLAPHPFAKGSNAVRGREQAVLVSTRPGEFAKEDTLPQTGYMTGRLLGLLETSRTLDHFFNVKPLHEALLKKLDDARAEGDVDQTPTYCEWKDWLDAQPSKRGSTDIAELDKFSRTYALERAAVQELLKIVQPMEPAIPARRVRDLFEWVTLVEKPPRVAAPAWRVLSHCLWRLASGLNLNGLFVFLELCREDFEKAGVAARVDAWITPVAKRRKINLEKIRQQAKARGDALPVVTPENTSWVLQILVVPLPGQLLDSDAYQLYVATRRSGTTDAAPTEVTERVAKSALELKEQLCELCVRSVSQIPASDSVRAEFFLPSEFLPAGASGWPVRNGKRLFPLDELLEVSLRSYDRSYGEHYAFSRRAAVNKWKIIVKGFSEENVAWLSPPSRGEAAAADSWHDDNIVTLGAHALPTPDAADSSDCVECLIGAGIPLAVWFLPDDAPAEWQQEIRKHFMQSPHHDWPSIARTLRRHPDKAKRLKLAVLLDNQDVPLPDLPGRKSGALRIPTSGTTP